MLVGLERYVRCEKVFLDIVLLLLFSFAVNLSTSLRFCNYFSISGPMMISREQMVL